MTGSSKAERRSTPYDLIVIGAGIAGLNALHAATVYLPRSARVLLIDEKDGPGGMWTMAYSYVRLHQPHPLFTAGNLKWEWRKPASHLADRDEVQNHLAKCLKTISSRLDLESRFRHSVCNERETLHSDGWRAEVDMHPTDAPESIETVEAHRVIHASGFNYKAPDKFAVSSQKVLSIAPQSLVDTLSAHPNAQVYVVGGGKTGMDTVLEVHNENNNRAVSLINGNGTYFLDRTRFFPTGARRWLGGSLIANIFRDCANRFNGHNEDEVRRYFLANYAVDTEPRNQNHIFGLLSQDENRRIEAALNDKIWDYLEDVVDHPEGPQMVLRNGPALPVAPGSIFVNCTGSIFRQAPPDQWKRCLSPNGIILSINTRHAMHFLTTYSSFILAHLYLSGKLHQAGLYFLDLEALLRKSNQAFMAATMAQSYHNLLIGLKNLPPSSRKYFGLDFNRWYPSPRRLLELRRIRKTAREDIEHCRKSLDAVVERFGIMGGQLD